MAVGHVNNAAGLWISPSPLQAPVGAYILADNVVINSPGIIESRRGFSCLAYELSSPGSSFPAPKTSFSYRGTLLVQHDFKLAYNSGTAFTDFSDLFYPPDTTGSVDTYRMRSEEAGLNVYFTTNFGVYGLDTPTGGQPFAAGEPRGPTPTSIGNATDVTGAPDTGWLEVNHQTGYVATFFRTDANSTDHEGTPSNPIFVVNPADITVPAGSATIVSITSVLIDFPNHGFRPGMQVAVVFNAADTQYISGTYTVANYAADPTNKFLLPGAAAALGLGLPTTQPTTISSGAKDVQVYVQLPAATAAGQTVLVYRAKISVSAAVPPRPQYYLNKEYVVTGTDVTNKYFTYTDEAPDSLLQDPLYTNTDDGEPPDGSLQNDDSQPPWCADLAEFDQRLWGANYKELQTLSMSLLGVGAPNGLQVGDTVQINTIAGNTFLAIAETSTPGVNQFRVYTSSDPGTNVARTAQEFTLAVITATNTVDAFYTSGPDDIPGQFLLRSRTPGETSFNVLVSRPSAWSPLMSATVGTNSTAAPQTNGLWFSKQSQPEAVPLLNRIPIGPRNAKILRIRPLRDKLFVFTDIAGVYVVSNSYPYQVTSLSGTATLIAPDSLVNFDDAIYCLTTQGVVKVNEAGPTILSVPIESELQALFGAALSTLQINAFGIAYESYRKYMLCMPTEVGDTANTQVWVYDTITKTWTRWDKAIDSGVVIPQTNTLFVTTPGSTKVSQERKNYNRTDYADEDFAVTITAAAGTAVTVTSTIAPVAGDLLLQSPITRSLIASVTTSAVNTYDLVMEDTVGWTLSSATCYPGIACELLNVPLALGAPEELKNFREVTYHFRTPGFSYGYGLFAGDLNPEIRSVGFSKGGWGEVPWGGFAWEQPARPVNKRVSVPTSARRVAYLSVGFSLREAQAQWQLMGVTPVYENMSERNSK